MDCIVHAFAESDMTERLSLFTNNGSARDENFQKSLNTDGLTYFPSGIITVHLLLGHIYTIGTELSYYVFYLHTN